VSLLAPARKAGRFFLSKIIPIPTETISNVTAEDKTPHQVGEQFRRLLTSGYQLKADGQAKLNPAKLLRTGYTPKYEIELFGTRYFLCNQRDAVGLKAVPAYVLQAPQWQRGKPTIYARVFYKDSSLVWRSVSHYINTPDEQWIGKGTVRFQQKRGRSEWASAEETTDLPFEMQAAMDDVSQRGKLKRNDTRILTQVARNAPSDRIRPYQDFEGPRMRAMKFKANRINNNRSIAWFTDDDMPETLQIEPGFEPDFKAVIDVSRSRSSMYGGKIQKYRIASTNRRIQYMFVAGPNHVWLVNPQALTVELSSYGLRTVDVIADEEMCIPGYEFFDFSGAGEIDDQIPPGFAGPMCPFDPDRADASPWNDRLPVIKAFRRQVLKQ